MSRLRKFKLGDLCLWNKPINGVLDIESMQYFGIVVDYTQDGTGRGRYRVIRTLHPISGATFGEPVWVDPHYLIPLDVPNRPTAVRVYRANEKLIERGCTCMCCAHEAIPKGQIRADGTFRYEQED